MIHKAIEVIRKEGVKVFFKKALNRLNYELKDLVLLPYALIKVKLINQKMNLNELVDFAFNGLSGVIRPVQVYKEISQLLGIVQKIKPRTVLEIGTAHGGTLFLFSRIASEDATIISIDLPGCYQQWRGLLYKSFALSKQKIYLLTMDSHKNETLEYVKAILSGRKLDFLFIDGDHTYEGVKKDFEMYSRLVESEGDSSIVDGPSSKSYLVSNRNNLVTQPNTSMDFSDFHAGRIIAFHDIVPGPIESVGEVHKFWKEIKVLYNSMEIVEDWAQGGCGIGVLFLK